jgi:hypothetical protein
MTTDAPANTPEKPLIYGKTMVSVSCSSLCKTPWMSNTKRKHLSALAARADTRRSISVLGARRDRKSKAH